MAREQYRWRIPHGGATFHCDPARRAHRHRGMLLLLLLNCKVCCPISSTGGALALSPTVQRLSLLLPTDAVAATAAHVQSSTVSPTDQFRLQTEATLLSQAEQVATVLLLLLRRCTFLQGSGPM